MGRVAAASSAVVCVCVSVCVCLSRYQLGPFMNENQTYTHKHQGYCSLPVEPDNAENVSITHNRRVDGITGAWVYKMTPCIIESHPESSTTSGQPVVHVSPTASYYRPGVGAAASGALSRAPPMTMCTGPLNAGGSAAAAGTSNGTSNGAA